MSKCLVAKWQLSEYPQYDCNFHLPLVKEALAIVTAPVILWGRRGRKLGSLHAQTKCSASREKYLKVVYGGPSISSIMIYAGFGDLLLKGAANLIWVWTKKFKQGAKELSMTLMGLDNKENMEAVRAMRIEMATMHAMVKAINRKVDILLAGPTRPVCPTLQLAPPPPLSPKENGEAVGEVNGGSDSEVK